MIRSVWVISVGIMLTLYYATRAVWSSWRKGPDLAGQCDCYARRWSKGLLWLAGVRVRIEGADQIDWSEPHVVVANHQSWFDVFALFSAMPTRLKFVAKEELGRIPVFGASWQGCEHISIDRGDRRQAIESLDRAALRVREEKLALVLFPEGTRSPDGRLQEFKKGAFVLAIKSGVPIVPVGISGSRLVMPKGTFRVRSGEIRIRVGSEIGVADATTGDREALREESRSAVLALMDDTDGRVGASDDPPTSDTIDGGETWGDAG